jgi:hypothetical protein
MLKNYELLIFFTKISFVLQKYKCFGFILRFIKVLKFKNYEIIYNIIIIFYKMINDWINDC